MKQKNKLLPIIVLLILTITLTGCKNDIQNNDKVSGKFLSIDDFKWKTKKSKCSGKDCYVFEITNNSNYDVLGVVFYYKVKPDTSEEDLELFDEFMNYHYGYIEEDDSPYDVNLKCSKDILISKGKKISNLVFTLGFDYWSWFEYPSEEQFDLMEPKELQVGIVDDNKFYVAYYDFKTKKWKYDKSKLDVNIWPKSSIAKKIDQPVSKHTLITDNKEDEFSFYAYDVTKDEFKNYYEKIKAKGFNGNNSLSSYTGKSSDGYEINIWYYEDTKVLHVNLIKE